MKKFDKEPVAWITRGGKHIPIFEDKLEPESDMKRLENLKKILNSNDDYPEANHLLGSDWIAKYPLKSYSPREFKRLIVKDFMQRFPELSGHIEQNFPYNLFL